MTEDARRFFNVRQAAEHIGVGVSTVHKAAASGRLAGSRVGSRWVFTDRDLDTWVRSCRVEHRVSRRHLSTA
jgi:excisionase family DNA binding protein